MKRQGRKSAAQTPSPPKERIYGSKKNPKGTASSKNTASKIQLSDSIIKGLKEKADKYNESHKGKVSVSTLKAVFRRGAGAYSSSHRPTITGGVPNSRNAWAYARVNKFLQKKAGNKVKKAYVQDDDLMAKGGQLKKPHTIFEIAEKHNLKTTDIVKALIKGQKKEQEHTKDDKIARTIALHHLWESPKYYEELKKLEKKFNDGGEIELNEIALPDSYSNIKNLNRILQNQGYHIVKIDENKQIFDTGGIVVGKSHQEADENGTGEKFKLKSTGQIVELEGGEAVIVGSAIDSEDKLMFEGEEKTPREIASFLNHAYGGVKFEKGGHITCGCSNKKYYHGGELPSSVVNSLNGGEAVITKKTIDSQDKYEFEGERLTPRQILSRINHRYGGVSFAKGGKLTKNTKDPVVIASKMIYFVNNLIYE